MFIFDQAKKKIPLTSKLYLFRVIPITIILYRYLMVCHVDFCLQKGEKRICQTLIKTSVALPTMVAFLSMFYLDNLRGSLICNGREEMFRFKTDNLFDEVFYGGVFILLPLYHPFRVFSIILGRIINPTFNFG